MRRTDIVLPLLEIMRTHRASISSDLLVIWEISTETDCIYVLRASNTPPPLCLVFDILSARYTVKIFKSKNSDESLSGVSHVSVRATILVSMIDDELFIMSNLVLMPRVF